MKNEYQTIKIYKKTLNIVRDVCLATDEGIAEMLDRLVLGEAERASSAIKAIKEVRSKYNKNG